MDREQQIKIEVMKRVRLIHRIQTIFNPLAIEVTLFFVAIVLLNIFVSVPNVIANIWHLPSAAQYGSYIASAFLHTRVIVQLVVLLASISLIFLAWGVIKNLKNLAGRRFA